MRQCFSQNMRNPDVNSEKHQQKPNCVTVGSRVAISAERSSPDHNMKHLLFDIFAAEHQNVAECLSVVIQHNVKIKQDLFKVTL